MIALDAAFYRSYDLMAMLYENRRTYEEALAIRQMRATVSGRGEAEVRGLRQAHTQAGEQGYWGFLLESSGSYVTCGETAEAPCDFRLSNIFAFLGRHKRALVALEEEVAQGKPALLTEVTPKNSSRCARNPDSAPSCSKAGCTSRTPRSCTFHNS